MVGGKTESGGRGRRHSTRHSGGWCVHCLIRSRVRSQHLQLLSPRKEKKASVEESSVLTGTKRALFSGGGGEFARWSIWIIAKSYLLFITFFIPGVGYNHIGRERESWFEKTRSTRTTGRTNSKPKERREERWPGWSNMFGMIKNSLFGNTEETEYKLLSSETKVSSARTPVTHTQLPSLWYL